MSVVRRATARSTIQNIANDTASNGSANASMPTPIKIGRGNPAFPIRALDGRTVRLTGYMIPVDMQGWNVRRCVIVPSQANCCFGQAPRFCEFVVATMTGADVPLALDVPLAFTGTLRVGDVAEGDVWSAFYTLECTAVELSLIHI